MEQEENNTSSWEILQMTCYKTMKADTSDDMLSWGTFIKELNASKEDLGYLWKYPNGKEVFLREMDKGLLLDLWGQLWNTLCGKNGQIPSDYPPFTIGDSVNKENLRKGLQEVTTELIHRKVKDPTFWNILRGCQDLHEQLKEEDYLQSMAIRVKMEEYEKGTFLWGTKGISQNWKDAIIKGFDKSEHESDFSTVPVKKLPRKKKQEKE